MPAIFSNTGVTSAIALHDESPGVGSAQTDPFFPPQRPVGGLSVIAERQVSETSPLVSPNAEMTEKPTSTWQALPRMMILQVRHLSNNAKV